MASFEQKFLALNATNDGDTTLISGVAGVQIVVVSYVLNVNAAGVIILQDSANTLLAKFEFVDGGGASYSGTEQSPAFKVPTGLGLEVSNAAGVDTFGHIGYYLRKGRG